MEHDGRSPQDHEKSREGSPAGPGGVSAGQGEKSGVEQGGEASGDIGGRGGAPETSGTPYAPAKPMLPPGRPEASEGSQGAADEPVDAEVVEEDTGDWQYTGDDRMRRAKARFIAAFRRYGVVNEANAAAGWKSRATAHRYADADPDFEAAWREAREDYADMLEREAERRSVEGTERPVFYRGEIVGHVTEYSDRLMELMLKAHRPDRFRERYEPPKNPEDSVNKSIEELAEALRLNPGKPPPAGGPERVPTEGQA